MTIVSEVLGLALPVIMSGVFVWIMFAHGEWLDRVVAKLHKRGNHANKNQEATR